MSSFLRTLQTLAIVAILAAWSTGCSSTKMKMEDDGPESVDKLFERYFGNLKEHKNRKIYKELTVEIINTIPDAHLEQAIRDFTALKIGHDWANDVERVPALGPGFSAVYFLSIMEAEVSNGGFYQFFYNEGRKAVLHARDGAELLGLSALSAVISKALQIEEIERDKMAKVKAEGTIEAFFESYDDISFEPADDAFQRLELDLQKAIVSFIRRRSELFEGRVTE